MLLLFCDQKHLTTRLDMYNDYFGLSDTPFSIAPNPQYLYMSERHREALAHLLYGIQSDGGFLLLTGEVGTGKTTVCRCLLGQVPDNVDTAFILNPKMTVIELLATICDDLNIPYPENASIKVLVDELNLYLLASHQQGRKTVVIIDEAQNLAVDVLEQLRLLTNLETDQRKLLQIILLGQPELLTILAGPELRQLSQRVTARFHLDALTRQEVAEYIQHRLKVAGAKGALFSARSIDRIFKITGGIPRLVNLVCDRSLLGTYAQNRLQVDTATVNEAAIEVLGPDQVKSNWMPALAASVAAIGVLSLLLYTGKDNQKPVADPASQPVVETIVSLPEDKPVEPATSDAIVETNPVAVFMEVSDPEYTAVDSMKGFPSQDKAFSALFRLWGHDLVLAPGTDACTIASDSDLQCLSLLGSLRDVSHLNRPVIVDLTNVHAESHYVITGISDEGISLVAADGTFLVERSDFLSIWNGLFTLLWRIPPAYTKASTLGDRDTTVDWLVSQIDLIDKVKPTYDTGNPFDLALEHKVKKFQISVGLIPDGIVGARTWIHINSTEGLGIPFIRKNASQD